MPRFQPVTATNWLNQLVKVVEFAYRTVTSSHWSSSTVWVVGKSWPKDCWYPLRGCWWWLQPQCNSRATTITEKYLNVMEVFFTRPGSGWRSMTESSTVSCCAFWDFLALLSEEEEEEEEDQGEEKEPGEEPLASLTFSDWSFYSWQFINRVIHPFRSNWIDNNSFEN